MIGFIIGFFSGALALFIVMALYAIKRPQQVRDGAIDFEQQWWKRSQDKKMSDINQKIKDATARTGKGKDQRG